MYFQSFQDFRLVPWFGAQAEAYRYFNLQKQFNITPFLTHINYHLGKTRVYLARHPTFTLVNVYCPMNRASYGFLDAPYWFHDPGKCLMLTFRSNLKTYKMRGRLPAHVRRPTEFSIVWGEDDSSAFTTIMIPMDFRPVLGMTFIRPQMEWLYTVFGSYYRNFVKFRWYDKYPKHSVPVAVRDMHLPDLMHRHSYPYWKYCKDVWRRCPNMISIDQIDKEFAAYYKENLTEFTGKMHSAAVQELESTIYSMMEDAPSYIEYGSTKGTSVEHVAGQVDVENRRESGR